MKKTNQRLLSPLLLLLAAMALLAFGVFTNVLTDLWGPGIKEQFQHNVWLIAAFALLLALVGYLYANQSSRTENVAPEAIDADQYDEAFGQFRALLLEQYTLRLNSKTTERLPINLSAKSTRYGFGPARADIYLEKQTIESPDIASEMDQILARHNRLLLIGDPGAGKTTILLYAAVNILNHAQEAKLPLILNLATWQTDRDFQDWYAQSIAHTYSLSPVFVAELLRRNAVVPFFDGFDEVFRYFRDDCFQKMTAYFGDQRSRQLIVSSRKKEYAAAQADAPVFAELEVLPLSLPQIKKALLENALSQASDQALLDALHRDEHLAKAVETPFYLNTASFLFGKGQRTWTDFPFKADSTEGRQVELVEIFVTEQVPEERDRKHLSFLAGKMEEENFLVFELVKMQPGWCGGMYRFHLANSLFSGVFVGSFFVFVQCIFNVFSNYYLTLGISSGFFVGFFDVEIRTQDIQIWRWKTLFKNWTQFWTIALISSFFISISFALAIGITFALGAGLLFGLIAGLKEAGTIRRFLLSLSKPYKRFSATFQTHFWLIPTIVLSIAAGIGCLFVQQGEMLLVNWKDQIQNPKWWQAAQGMSLFFILVPFLTSMFLQHFALRLILYLEKKLPLRVVTFLDRMTDQHILEDNRRTVKGQKMRGATWRFRHKILQDYFAKAKAQET